MIATAVAGWWTEILRNHPGPQIQDMSLEGVPDDKKIVVSVAVKDAHAASVDEEVLQRFHDALKAGIVRNLGRSNSVQIETQYEPASPLLIEALEVVGIQPHSLSLPWQTEISILPGGQLRTRGNALEPLKAQIEDFKLPENLAALMQNVAVA